jgi:transcriptional regulator with XRE-family HTH domain
MIARNPKRFAQVLNVTKLQLTRQELADRVGVSVRTVARWELGLAVPRRNNLERLAEVVGVVPEYLLLGPELILGPRPGSKSG